MSVVTSDLLTREEAATYLGVRPQTLAMWHANGRYSLRCVKVGRLVRYRKADLDQWLASRTAVSSGANLAEPAIAE
jgi:excisionase family DNA binding protein